MLDNLKHFWRTSTLGVKVIIIAAIVFILLAIGTSANAADGDCETQTLSDKVYKICSFEVADSPACVPLNEYPDGPEQFARSLQGTVTRYEHSEQEGVYFLGVERPAGRVIVFSHPEDFDRMEDPWLCLRATIRPIEGAPA